MTPDSNFSSVDAAAHERLQGPSQDRLQGPSPVRRSAPSRRAVVTALTLVLLLSGCPLSSQPTTPVVTPPDATEPLTELLDRTLADNQRYRQLSTRVHGGWQILHGVLAYGKSFEVETAEGMQPAVDYLMNGGRISGFDPLPGDELGAPPRRGLKMELQPTTKIGQGHRDQWLAILAQAGVSEDAVIRSPQHDYTVADWVRQVEYDVPLNFEWEFSWTLIGLTAYRPTDHSWVARDGNTYSIEWMVDREVQQSLPESVCGGTHRLIGLAMALQKRRQEGQPILGSWALAESIIENAIAAAKQNQNPDGSYSVAYHHRTGWTRDLGESLGTTGHVLEFLAIAAPDATLQEPWVERSVRRICEVLEECGEIDLECGVLYHALHGLHEYQQRISHQG